MALLQRWLGRACPAIGPRLGAYFRDPPLHSRLPANHALAISHHESIIAISRASFRSYFERLGLWPHAACRSHADRSGSIRQMLGSCSEHYATPMSPCIQERCPRLGIQSTELIRFGLLLGSLQDSSSIGPEVNVYRWLKVCFTLQESSSMPMSNASTGNVETKYAEQWLLLAATSVFPMVFFEYLLVSRS